MGIHRKPKEDRTWSTGPAPPEEYLMEFDLGSVRDFDCSLAFCYVMETVENPVDLQPKLRHVPADRVSCTEVPTGYQWTKCMENGNLMLFENEVCGVDSVSLKTLRLPSFPPSQQKHQYDLDNEANNPM